jgi:putative SOS response-associated peptidase YedK
METSFIRILVNMCYYNTIYTKKAKNIVIAKENIVLPTSNLGVQSGFTHPKWPIITFENNKPVLMIANWGFLPKTIQNELAIKNFREQFNTLNAKHETIQDSKLYGSILQSNKCIIPSSGFVEWQHTTIDKSKKVEKIPYFIHPKSEDEIFWMCGLYNKNSHAEYNITNYTFTILTTKANSLMATIHNNKKRMPCIIKENALEKWLFNKSDYTNEMAIQEKEMHTYTIAKDFLQKKFPLNEVLYQKALQGSLF